MVVTQVNRTLSHSPSPCFTIEQGSHTTMLSTSGEGKGPSTSGSESQVQLANRVSVQEKTAPEGQERMSDLQTKEDQGTWISLSGI